MYCHLHSNRQVKSIQFQCKYSLFSCVSDSSVWHMSVLTWIAYLFQSQVVTSLFLDFLFWPFLIDIILLLFYFYEIGLFSSIKLYLLLTSEVLTSKIYKFSQIYIIFYERKCSHFYWAYWDYNLCRFLYHFKFVSFYSKLRKCSTQFPIHILWINFISQCSYYELI